MRKHQPNLKICNFRKKKKTLRNERYIFILCCLSTFNFCFRFVVSISFLHKEVNGSSIPNKKNVFGLEKKSVDYIKFTNCTHISYLLPGAHLLFTDSAVSDSLRPHGL